MWIRTQGGDLVNLDHVIRIYAYENVVNIMVPSTGDKAIGRYRDAADAFAVMNMITSWIDKPGPQSVFVMPMQEVLV